MVGWFWLYLDKLLGYFEMCSPNKPAHLPTEVAASQYAHNRASHTKSPNVI